MSERRFAVELATELTIAWLGNQNNRISADEVPTFLRTMHQTVSDLSSGETSVSEEPSDSSTAATFTPAISARKSLASRDHIISMIDGKPIDRCAGIYPGMGSRPISIASVTA